MEDAEIRIENALEILSRYGQIDGDHHKLWVIDQTVRALTEENYDQWVENQMSDGTDPFAYDWNEGIAP